ncbi:MAG: hypothetical protein COW66_13035 [Flavobacteriaceae bacterium CG18_big_fil_WC_8_21_14_2_50_34_36]|nr:hypothetical protein [Flavobacteriia bacterium]NCT18052.1 hypothetical protein [Flavobacteriia bacterium]PIQ17191.1 MAG: hypothetical protein COW66_13035 [Flavobacteriaceae bacterium CG18_big_fil_WC_8_21_14_2_50_34_36]PJC08215.1 MAG: hypothetical protein CO068_02200 [Flavobacteriaceae bacterium CG_4_9_14_0_8_um_filter_34_30]
MVKRSFILGDEWLYYKIYSGAKTSDLILMDIIKPIAESLLKENIIDKWFFIRYADPKHHVRIRFHYNNPKAVGKIIDSLQPHFIEYISEDLIWKIQTDTYNRELERYGKHTMEFSETIFFHDSEAITNFLSLIEGEEGEELRWLFGLRMVDALLDSFSFPNELKFKFLERLKTGFGNEFGMNRFLKKQLDNKYRQQKKKIEDFLAFDALEKPDYLPILQVLTTYKEALFPIAQRLNHLNSLKTLEIEIVNLLSSYIHMTMNRLFKSKNRIHEMVVYDFLYRYYKSTVARSNKKLVRHD